jgi:hypothetical protein
MDIKTRAISACASLLIVLGVIVQAPATLAQTPANSITGRLIGNWQLVSIRLSDTGPYGENPQGNMSFDAGGRFSVIVLSAGRARSISYYGTYTVNDANGSMTIHIDGSSLPHEIGRDLKRILAFNGDELVVQSPNGNVTLTWKRSS